MICTEPACLFKATHTLHWNDIITSTPLQRTICFSHAREWKDLIKKATKQPVKFRLAYGQGRYESIISARVTKIRGR